jgi:predicted transcriptional regulator of viral defense system
MGKRIHLDMIESFFEKSPVVDFNSIERIIRSKKKVKHYAKKLVSQLLKRGKIKRLAKGYYTKFDDITLSVFCFQPAYLGLQDSLSAHELWEQETIPIILTSRKTNPGIRVITGGNVMVKRIDKKYVFGIEYLKQGDFYFPYSDIEKTFIDMIYFKQYIDKEVIKEFKRKIDKKKLNSYLKLYPKRFRKIVLKRIGRLN